MSEESFVLPGIDVEPGRLKRLLKWTDVRYLIIYTQYTANHIERTNYKDRGRFKWIAETKNEAYEDGVMVKEARTCHIDGGDLFPRLYFHEECFVDEFLAWCGSRMQSIQEIIIPKEYSPLLTEEMVILSMVDFSRTR